VPDEARPLIVLVAMLATETFLALDHTLDRTTRAQAIRWLTRKLETMRADA
jgi:hypothetical protein